MAASGAVVADGGGIRSGRFAGTRQQDGGQRQTGGRNRSAGVIIARAPLGADGPPNIIVAVC